MNERIYVCHTYYHAYVAFLKELHLRRGKNREDTGEASLMLSSMSNDFEQFGERVKATGLFADVISFDEKRVKRSPSPSQTASRAKSWEKNACSRRRRSVPMGML